MGQAVALDLNFYVEERSYQSINSSINLSNPDSDDFSLKSVDAKSNNSGRVDINGLTYYCISKKFVISPAKSGALTLDSFSVNLSVGSGGFFSMSKPVVVKSDSLDFNILDVDVDNVDQVIVASDLKVMDVWDDEDSPAQIDQSIKRKIILSAKNSDLSYIKSIKTKYDKSKVRLYEENPSSKVEVLGNNDVLETKFFTYVVVPKASGQVVFPEFEIEWFDVSSGMIKYETIPERVIAVSNVVSDNNTDSQLSGIVARHEPQEDKLAPKLPLKENKWFYIAVFFAALWLINFIILILVLVGRRKPKQSPSNAPGFVSRTINAVKKSLKSDILKASCDKQDAKNIIKILPKWFSGKSKSKCDSISHLIANFPELKSYIYSLQSICYSGKDKDDFDFDKFYSVCVKQALKKKDSRKNDLDGLYPS